MGIQIERDQGQWIAPGTQTALRYEFPGSRKRILQNELIRRILVKGKISASEWMETLLYGENGYYNNTRIGEDFFTPPEFFPQIGECMYHFVHAIYDDLNRPARFPVIEAGAGNGTLPESFLVAAREDPEFFSALEYHIIEISPHLIKLQQERVGKDDLHSGKVTWREQDITTVDFPSYAHGVYIMMEVDDALPPRFLLKRGSNPNELFLTIRDNAIIEEEDTPEDEALALIARYPEWWEDVPEGKLMPVNIAGVRLREQIAEKLKKGAIITVDYGFTSPQRVPQDPVRTYWRNHNRLFLQDPIASMIPYAGYADHTSYVDFRLINLPADLAGFETYMLTQSSFLRHHHMEEIVAREAKWLAQANPEGLKTFFAKVANVVDMGVNDWLVSIQTKGVKPLQLPEESSHIPSPDWLYKLAQSYGLTRNDVTPPQRKGLMR